MARALRARVVAEGVRRPSSSPRWVCRSSLGPCAFTQRLSSAPSAIGDRTRRPTYSGRVSTWRTLGKHTAVLDLVRAARVDRRRSPRQLVEQADGRPASRPPRALPRRASSPPTNAASAPRRTRRRPLDPRGRAQRPSERAAPRGAGWGAMPSIASGPSDTPRDEKTRRRISQLPRAVRRSRWSAGLARQHHKQARAKSPAMPAFQATTRWTSCSARRSWRLRPRSAPRARTAHSSSRSRAAGALFWQRWTRRRTGSGSA